MNYLIAGKYPDGTGDAKLSPREVEITELSAWGASQQDIAEKLFISKHTVENHFRNIFKETGCRKINQLSSWWFCVKYNISFDLSPVAKSAKKISMLLFIAIFVSSSTLLHSQRRPRLRRRQDVDYIIQNTIVSPIGKNISILNRYEDT